MKIRAAILTGALAVAAGCSDDEDSADTTSAATTAEAATSTAAAATTTAARATTTDATTTISADDATTTDARSTDDTRDTTDGSDDTASAGTGLDDRIDTVSEALENGDFSVMLEALNLSGLAEELEGQEITILAPTNEAFTGLDVGDYADLLTDADAVEELISRHIIDEVLSYEELSERTEVTVRSGDTYTVTFENEVLMIDGVTVTEPGPDALEGDAGQEVAVLSIDSVLLEAAP
jgi:uncharacterized surface protein with fasciclin (FAS1) repeats